MRTQIIVLHRYPYRDSSWIVRALSPQVGLMQILVKGAKNGKSPFRVGIDPLCFSEIEVRYKPNVLLLPKEITLLDYFPKLRSKLSDLALAQLLAEIILKLNTGESHAQEEFEWLYRNLKELNNLGAKNNSLSLWLQQLCNILGYAPILSFCGKCGAPIQEKAADLWLAQGGAICNTCLGTRKPVYSSEFLEELGLFSKGKNLNQSGWLRIENFFLKHLRTHTGTLEKLNSWEWLMENRSLCGESSGV